MDYIVIECEEETAQEISKQFAKNPGVEFHASGQENLDGDAATWIVVATLTIEAMPIITNLLSRLLDKPSVSIELEGIKYEGPLSKETQMEIEKALRTHVQKMNSE